MSDNCKILKNFHSLEAVDILSEAQLDVSEKNLAVKVLNIISSAVGMKMSVVFEIDAKCQTYFRV